MNIRKILPLAVLSAICSRADVSAAEIPVTDPTLLAGLSPYNWVCGKDSINASVAGSSLTLAFRGSGKVVLKLDNSHLANVPAERCPIIAWTVNGGAVKSHQLATGETSVPLTSGVANPVIDLYIKGMSPIEDRWNGDVPANSVRITGLETDAGLALVPLKFPAKIWLNIGDSIMSGDGAAYRGSQGRPPDGGWAASSDGRASYGCLLARHFGYRESRIAYGGYNWTGGLAGVPALTKLIDNRTSTASRLVEGLLSPLPDVVLVNLGENGVPADQDVVASLKHLRSRIGKEARMLVMLPVSGRSGSEITRAFSSYQSGASDGNSFLIDLGKIQFEVCDGQHPTAAGHQGIFEAARPVCEKIFAGGAAVADPAKTALGEPFWESKIMRDEPILFVMEEGKEMATGRLLFKPNGKLKITSPDLKTTYENGRDYVWKAGADTIELKAGSRIPFKTAAEMVPPPGSPNTLGGVLFSEGAFFHNLQVQVTYQHAGKWDWRPPVNEKRLARTISKLKARQPVKIVALGDSITEGYNASGFTKVNVAPYQPAFPGLVANTLQKRFGSHVTLVNLGLGGTRADWGIGEVAKVTAQNPDLVILAFGMNHNEAAPAFGETMAKLLAAVQAGVPSADVVLVSSMAGNPRVFPVDRFTSYRDVLSKLQSPDVALADVTTPWLELVKRKPFADLSGNHVNHPNDFAHRLYAEVICQLFQTNPPRK